MNSQIIYSGKNNSENMYRLIKTIFPICRSITGDGVRETLKIIQKDIPISIHEVDTGTKVFDWEVPMEWNIRDAYIKDSNGKRVVDFRKSNLHVVNYSIPVKKKLSLTELKKNIHTLPQEPDLIPYRTSYYKKEWGFCMKHSDFLELKDETYEVVIDSTLSKGSLTYGEYLVKGNTQEEILISTHICHPSLCNDNLSGIAVSTYLAQEVAKIKNRRYTYRFLFVPGTIGSLTWLSTHKSIIKKVKYALVLTGLGDPGSLTYKKTRSGNSEIDYIFERVFSRVPRSSIVDFSPFGYDERQYSSPGINIPTGTLMRSPHGTYKEYHTSGDNLTFIRKSSLANSLDILLQAIQQLENNVVYTNLYPHGEPQLGKRNLYDAMAEQPEDKKLIQMATLWILNYSDSNYSLATISQKSQIDIGLLKKVAEILEKSNVIKKTYE